MEKGAKNILIIEDDELFANKIIFFLAELNCSTSSVTTAARGMYSLSVNKPNIVFLDNKLPRIEGIEVVSLFKEISPTTKIALMSSVFTQEDKLKAFDSGVDFVIDKQELTKDDLVNIVLGIDNKFSIKAKSSRLLPQEN